MTLKIFIGWDSRETDAYQVCIDSLQKHSSQKLDITPIVKDTLIDTGEYYRPQPEAGSVEFTYTRFLTPYLAEFNDWALFIDCDFLFTRDVAELFAMADDKYALMCAKHDYIPKNAVKMDGQKQVSYPRKNWSSCILWNCGHPANAILNPDVVSKESGAFLHRFYWLPDELIGSIPIEWNWLEGEYDKPDVPPAAIHFTNGGPWFDEWQDVDYADLWRSYL
jgi:hypothetical protein|tara:strand:- start:1002 stop:1664 length:663 start_codon:yes stop_codon:yes gene_type:complete